jgi:hypothetical protein
MSELGSYTFVPWFRRGLATRIGQPDNPADTGKGRASFTAEMVLGVTPIGGAAGAPPAIARTVELISPPDVEKLKVGTVLRVHPPRDSPDATPGELAYVEFYDEDLPWRYTPARPAYVEYDPTTRSWRSTPTTSATVSASGRTVPRLRPWLALLVLRDDEFELLERANDLAVLTVRPLVPLPPPDENWAWAHAQLTGEATAQAAGTKVDANPDAALSRILSPRRLEPGALYGAFLVPAYNTARSAGLGLDPAGIPTQQPSWGPAVTDRRFPVYDWWRFATKNDGSFESYVRRLKALRADQITDPTLGSPTDFGRRSVTVAVPGYGIAASALPAIVKVEGVLAPPNSTRDPYPLEPGSVAVAALQATVDLAVSRLTPGHVEEIDPGLVPPAYGRWHAGVGRLADVRDSDDVGWVREVNLDLRQRAAAGLGAQIVRNKQADLMERAWAQVGRLRDANQRLREGELAMAAAEAMFDKHLTGLNGDRLMLLTAATHHGLVAPAAAVAPAPIGTTQTPPAPTLRALVRDSAVPTSTQDAAFKRATRPNRVLVRQATGRRDVLGFQDGNLVPRLNDGEVSAAPPLAAPVGAVSLADVQAVAAAAATAIGPKLMEPKRVFWQLLVDVLSTWTQTHGPAALPSAGQLQELARPALAQWHAVHPQETDVNHRVGLLINGIVKVTPDGLDAATVTIQDGPFQDEFGKKLIGKGGDGVTIVPEHPPAGGKVARMADANAAQAYADASSQLGGDLARRLGLAPSPLEPITALTAVATTIVDGLRPENALFARIATALPGFAAEVDRQAQNRARRLRPVLAYPVFDDPMFTALAALDQEYILPNLGQIPADTLTLMRPNGRFIEAFFAGLNTEMARELLWREYPTDQRGSYFRRLWSRADALDGILPYDINPMPEWTAALGGNSPTSGAPMVLVMRSELLRKFPNTVVYAQPAVFAGPGRQLNQTAAPIFPIFHASLDPDVTLLGFAISEEKARGRTATATDPGDPGVFFVLKERPGQIRFGLDLTAPAGGLRTWEDLWWGQLSGAPPTTPTGATPAAGAGPAYIELAASAPPPNAPVPSAPPPGTRVSTPAGSADATPLWAATSADMAAILLRSPVMYARHASDLLPKRAGS